MCERTLSKELERFLERLEKNLPSYVSKTDIMDEVRDHISEAYFDLIQRGVDERVAEDIVMDSFGDIMQLEKGFKRAGRYRIKQSVLRSRTLPIAVCVACSLFGLSVFQLYTHQERILTQLNEGLRKNKVQVDLERDLRPGEAMKIAEEYDQALERANGYDVDLLYMEDDTVLVVEEGPTGRWTSGPDGWYVPDWQYGEDGWYIAGRR